PDSAAPSTLTPSGSGLVAADSVTVLDSSALEVRRITGLDTVAEALPEISYTPALNSLTTLSLYMRGAGPAAPGQITLDGAVGVYQDGFYIPRAQANTFDLLDLDRVDVLAGPQGATYGRDTTGGVINLVSKAPSGTLGFSQDVDFGNRNSYRVLSSFDAPGWRGLAAKVILLASGVDGYVNNEYVNSHDYGTEKQRAARLQLRWNGPADLRADYFIERSGLDSTPEYLSNPTQNGEELYIGYTYYADPTGPMHTTYRPVFLPLSTANHTMQGLTLTWSAWSALTIHSRTGYRTLDADEQMDTAEFYGEPFGSVDQYQQHQFSQDLQLSGNFFGHQLDYVAGGSYFREKGHHSADAILLTAGESELRAVSAESRSQSVYARLHWQPELLGRRVEVSVAGRYTRDSKDAERSVLLNGTDALETGVRSHLSYGRSTPEFDLVYHLAGDVSAYAKVATGYQAGGALESATIGEFATLPFRPESDTTYEVGLRSAFLDRRLRLDVAAFDSHRKDAQYTIPVDLIDQDAYDFQRVTVKGASLDVRITPIRDLTLSASAVYLDWRINRADVIADTVLDSSSQSGSPYGVGQNISEVFALPYTPKYSGSLAGDYALWHTYGSDLLLHLDYVYRARMFADAAAGPAVPGAKFDTQPAYGLLSGRVTLARETDWAHRVKFSLWARNLLDRKYYQPASPIGAGLSGFDTSGSVATPSGYTARAGAWAEPRTYGIAIRYEY
ncbi:MAG TPA: TonB-dependent receptor plug domain-containing protein, partial [Steroidobacteraceae bacterium]|nr:TonB-dependent receptor plug domain-containing protein [Steroidobacteraceae bacterium]